MKLSEVFKPNIPWDLTREEQQLEAVKRDGYLIRHIKNPSEAVQLAAIAENDWAIQFIMNPSEIVQLAAVTQNGYAIQHIENPSEAVQLAAVTKFVDAIEYIENPTQLVIKTILTNPIVIYDNQKYYERLVKEIFKDNTLLMKKWLRYGETMRNSYETN
jgi:hypothetical protein